MAATTPPPPSQPPWVTDLGPGPAQPPYDGGSSAGRGTKILVLTTVLVLLMGGGAFAFFTIDPFHLFRSGPQASEAIPADAIFYAGLDLDPKASQKVDALRFLNHFPAFRENAGLTDANADIADQVVGRAIDDLDCPGVSYADDVKPWLGERFGIAVMPPTSGSDVPVVLAVQTSDDDAARQGIETLNRCEAATSATPTGATLGVAFANGFMLLAETQDQADAFATSAGEHALADDPDFQADLGSLGELGVVTMWADVAGAIHSYADRLPQGSELQGISSAAGRVAATFRFASDHIEVAASAFGDTSAVDQVDNPIVGLPDSTVFAISESGGDQRIGSAWQKGIEQVRKGDPSIDDQIQQFEAETGLSLPTDLETLFGHNIMLALDARGLTGDELSGDDFSKLSFGARFTNDPDKLNALYTKVTDLIRQAAGTDIQLAKQDFEDGIAIASNDAYAGTLAELDGDLGDSDAFRSVVDDGASQEFVMFFNFDAIKGQVLKAMTEDGAPQEAIDNIRPLKAFGITSDVSGDYQHLTLRLSVDD
jgi:hypothetical protein